MKYGEIVELGRHRLMCGDATKSEDVYALVAGERVNLVLTDPPYGVNTNGNYNFTESFGLYGRKEKESYPIRYKKVIGDKSTSTARKAYELMQTITDKIILWGGNYFTDFLPPSKCWLVWYKHQSLWNHSDCELAYTNLKDHVRLYDQMWSGACRAGSHKLNPRPAIHPTQKPVELHAHILEDFSQEGDIILDCFGGSGTTLIASEITNRRCLMMEISPDYCDIIINRYKLLTEGAINFA